MVKAALTGETIAKVGSMAKIVGATASEISRNNSMLPRFKVDLELEFHDTKIFEPLCVDLSPSLRVPFIILPRFIAGT
jgi:hypothetical protein